MTPTLQCEYFSEMCGQTLLFHQKESVSETIIEKMNDSWDVAMDVK